MIRKFGLAALLLVMGSLMAHAADITGKWTGKFITPVGVNSYVYNFQVNGSVLAGQAVSSDTGAAPVQNGKINGDTLSFTEPAKFNGAPVTVKYTGKIIGETIKLTRAFADFPPDTFTIKRAK